MNNLSSLIFVFILILPQQFFSEEQPQDLIYQKLLALEKEIKALRNMVEENTYLIERYQELQQQRYLDLDKRLHNLFLEEVQDLTIESSLNNTLQMTEEVDLYKNALEFFEDSRYAEALESFRKLIISFPDGKYSADAYFWSGELFLVQDLLEDARENYLVVVDKYPGHERVTDSLYKLGLIEKTLFNNKEANSYFSRLISEYPDTGAAELAKKTMESFVQESN